MKTHMRAVETTFITLNTSIKEVAQEFDVYNIDTNQSFTQLSMKPGGNIAYITAMREEQVMMVDEIKALKVQKRSLQINYQR